jgi:hypothetical protein
MLVSLQALSERLQTLLQAQPSAQSEILAGELVVDMRDWCVGVQQALGQLSADPGTVDHAAFRSRLEAMLTRLEARVEDAR